LNQLGGVGITVALSVAGTIVILKVVDIVVGLRVGEDEEVQGLDITQHGEEGYHADLDLIPSAPPIQASASPAATTATSAITEPA